MDKIYTLIENLKGNERKELHLFLNSPYFNKNKSVITLYSLLLNLSERKNYLKIDTPEIYKKIFKTGLYKSSTMRNLLSDLTNLILNFSAYKYLENSESGYFRDCYIKGIKKRKITNEYYYKFKEWEKEFINNDNIVEIDFAKEGMAFYNNKLNIDIINDGETKKFDLNQRVEDFKKLTVKTSLIDFLYSIKCYSALSTIDFKFSTTKEKFTGELSKIADLTYKKIFEQYKFLKQSGLFGDVIDIYISLTELIKKTRENKIIKCEEFKNIKILINKNENSIGREELNFLFEELIRIIYSLENTNEKQFLKLNHLKEFFGKNYFISRDSSDIDASLFRITLLACFDVKDFDFAKLFLDEYSKYITLSQRDAMTNLGYAFYYNRTGNFDKSLFHLNKTDFIKQIFEYDARILFIRNFYELNYIDSSLEQVKNFKTLLSKKEKKAGLTISEEAHKNFLTYFEKFIKDSEKFDEESIMFYIEKLNNEKNIVLGNWLKTIMTNTVTEILKTKNNNKTKKLKSA